MSKVILQCEALSRVYDDGDRSVTVLENVDLTLLAGEKIAVVGASGSGKTVVASQIAAHMAINQQAKGVFISTEQKGP